MSVQPGDMVHPGVEIGGITAIRGITILGPGLRAKDAKINRNVVATLAGIYRSKSNVYWVDSDPKRYLPHKGDLVVGIITKKSGDTLKLDINSSEPASLSFYAFEGATKKQKPDVSVGDAIYARVVAAQREMEAELICVDKYFKAGILGPLSNDGYVTKISIRLAHRLLDVKNPLLRTLGRQFAFEVAVGMNGWVWVNAKEIAHVLKVVKVLEAAETQSDKDVISLCNKYL